jgi:hypothetical protein
MVIAAACQPLALRGSLIVCARLMGLWTTIPILLSLVQPDENLAAEVQPFNCSRRSSAKEETLPFWRWWRS